MIINIIITTTFIIMLFFFIPSWSLSWALLFTLIFLFLKVVIGFIIVTIMKFFSKKSFLHFYIWRLLSLCSILLLIDMYRTSIGDYLSLLVISEFSWTPLLIQKEQQDQPFQLPKPSPGCGLRKWICRWWEQHFWGQPQSEGLFFFPPKEGSTQQQYEPVQLLFASQISAPGDQAQLCRLQWGCVSGGWECAPLVTWGAPSA